MANIAINFMISFLLIFPLNIFALSDKPILIVLSFDGFRHDYAKKTYTPNFHKIMDDGVRVPYMKNAFVTKTFPNHQTLATGLWTESHGIVDKKVFDEVHGKTLGIGDKDFYRFNDQVIPIWVRNEWAGNGRKSGVIMWPGSAHGYGRNYSKPSNFIDFDPSISFEKRIDIGIDWITAKRNPINLLMIYFNEPDSTGHRNGPESEQVKKMIRDQDKLLGYFIKKLQDERLYKKVNVILLSDHGMEEVKKRGIIEIPRDIKDLFEIKTGSSPVWNIKPKRGKSEELYTKLKNLAKAKNDKFKVYKKWEIPKEWHVANNRRVLPIMIVAESGYIFDDLRIEGDRTIGVHGYSTSDSNMWPFFLAQGPRFRSDYKGPAIENVDVFPLMSFILDIPVAPNNGTLSHTSKLIKRT